MALIAQGLDIYQSETVIAREPDFCYCEAVFAEAISACHLLLICHRERLVNDAHSCFVTKAGFLLHHRKLL